MKHILSVYTHTQTTTITALIKSTERTIDGQCPPLLLITRQTGEIEMIQTRSVFGHSRTLGTSSLWYRIQMGHYSVRKSQRMPRRNHIPPFQLRTEHPLVSDAAKTDMRFRFIAIPHDQAVHISAVAARNARLLIRFFCTRFEHHMIMLQNVNKQRISRPLGDWDSLFAIFTYVCTLFHFRNDTIVAKNGVMRCLVRGTDDWTPYFTNSVPPIVCE